MSRFTRAVALACLTAALAAQGGRWSAAFDLLTQGAPIWFLGAAMATLAATAPCVSGRAAIAVAGVLGMAASAALMAPELLRPPPGSAAEPGSPRLRIIQLNVGGTGLRDPAAAAAWLASQRPDLVCLDDVDEPLKAAVERQGFRWRAGAAYTAIASRAPTRRPLAAFSTSDWRTMPDMARAVFGGPTAPANLIAVHPIRPYLPGERHEIARLRSLVDRYDPRDLIVAGDLNLTPWSFELRRLDRNLGLQRRDKAVPTWPARLFGVAWPLPFLPLDHVYAGSMWRTIDVRRGPYLGATHYPLVVDLQRIGGS